MDPRRGLDDILEGVDTSSMDSAVGQYYPILDTMLAPQEVLSLDSLFTKDHCLQHFNLMTGHLASHLNSCPYDHGNEGLTLYSAAEMYKQMYDEIHDRMRTLYIRQAGAAISTWEITNWEKLSTYVIESTPCITCGTAIDERIKNMGCGSCAHHRHSKPFPYFACLCDLIRCHSVWNHHYSNLPLPRNEDDDRKLMGGTQYFLDYKLARTIQAENGRF